MFRRARGDRYTTEQIFSGHCASFRGTIPSPTLWCTVLSHPMNQFWAYVDELNTFNMVVDVQKELQNCSISERKARNKVSTTHCCYCLILLERFKPHAVLHTGRNKCSMASSPSLQHWGSIYAPRANPLYSLIQWVFKDNLLPSKLLVYTSESIQLVLCCSSIFRIQENLEDHTQFTLCQCATDYSLIHKVEKVA